MRTAQIRSDAEGVIIVLPILPPFREAIWLWIASGGGLALVGFAVVRWRAQTNRQRSLELARLVERRTQEIERRRQVSDDLREVILRINQNLPLEESLGYIARRAAQILQADWAGLFQSGTDGQVRLLAASRMVDPVSGPILGQMIEVFSRHLQKNPLPAQIPFENLQPGLHCDCDAMLSGIQRAVIYPVMLDGAVYGGLAVLLGNKSHLTREAQDLLATFCDQAALAIGNEKLRKKAEELAVVAERNRLGRDLHDAVTQTLFSASLIAETLPVMLKDDPQEGLELLAELRQLTRGALAEMRTLLTELRPAVMVDAKLPDLLRQLAEAVTGKKGIAVQFHTVEITPLPEDVHICLYRIAQEALANVVKHSRAKHIAVTLSEQPLNGCGRSVMLEVCDDGRGFALDRIPPDHFGLKNMRERAQAAGARLEILSNPGAGTTVRATWTGKDG